MSSTIDWSKAPEWAGAVIKARCGTQFWVEQFGEASKRQRLDNQPDMLRATYPSGHGWTLVETRPTESPVWNGEGLPPVGTVCEFRWSLNNWKPCTVFAHQRNANEGVDVLVDVGDDWSFSSKPDWFRPVRTPEQVAAEAKSEVVRDMIRIWKVPPVGSEFNYAHDRAASLYDAGYRKVEQP